MKDISTKAVIFVNVAGIALLLVGVILHGSDVTVFRGVKLDAVVDAIGIAAFLLSVATEITRLLESSGRVEVELGNIRKAMADYQAKADLRTGQLDQIVDTLIRTRAGEVNDTIVRLRREDWPIHSSSSKLLERLVTRHLPDLAAELLKVDIEGRLDPISIGDLHTIGMLLEELAQHLPRGSVWLGLSKLQSPDAWGKSLGAWNDRLMDRSEHGEVHVCRVWALQSAAQLPALLMEMQRQKRRRAIVRYALDDSQAGIIPDLSLIWVPTGAAPLDLGLLANDPLGALAAASYRRLHGLEFEVGSSLILSRVKILPRETLTRDCERIFSAMWAKGSPASAEPDGGRVEAVIQAVAAERTA